MSLFAPMRRWLSASSVYPPSMHDHTSPESVTAFFTCLDVSLNDIVSEGVGAVTGSVTPSAVSMNVLMYMYVRMTSTLWAVKILCVACVCLSVSYGGHCDLWKPWHTLL